MDSGHVLYGKNLENCLPKLFLGLARFCLLILPLFGGRNAICIDTEWSRRMAYVVLVTEQQYNAESFQSHLWDFIQIKQNSLFCVCELTI